MRSAVVRISGGDIERTLKVVQGAAGFVLSFESPRYAAAAGEDMDVAVTANTSYTLTIPEDCDWMEDITSRTEGLAANTHRLRVDANDGVAPRSVRIGVASTEDGGPAKTLVVEQQGGEPALDIDGGNEFEIPWNQTSMLLCVTANVTYRTEIDYGDSPEWVWRVATRGMETRDEKFVINENMTASPRTATIRFFSDDKDASPAIRREVALTQGPYTIPGENVFELATPPDGKLSFTSGRQPVTVELRTGARRSGYTHRGARLDNGGGQSRAHARHTRI